MEIEKKAFNQYCADVEGKDTRKVLDYICISSNDGSCWIEYSPFDDANQRHEVFDKLWTKCATTSHMLKLLYAFNPADGIDQAEKEFIWSTRDEQN